MKSIKQLLAAWLVLAAVVALPLVKVAVVGTGVVALVSMEGCAADARTRWSQARLTLTRTENTIGMLHEQGIITDAELVNTADPAIRSARGALDAAEIEMAAGNEDGFLTFMAIVEGALDELLILAAQQQPE